MKVIFVLAVLATGIFCASCSKNNATEEQPITAAAGQGPQGATLDTEGYCDEGENEDPHPMICGNVYDTLGNGILHACVAIKTGLGVQVDIIGTDSAGHYFFNAVSNGSYTLEVSCPGFITKSTPISVSGTPQTANVVLHQ